jgi:serine/threonine-protein kinase
MPAQVNLIVTDAYSQKSEYSFMEPARCVVGRSADCDIRVAPDGMHADVSRHHCEFEIEPPKIRVRDLGSRNGTFVNEEMIGHRDHEYLPEESIERRAETAHDLKHGDEVRIGHTVIRVEVQVTSDVLQPMYFG